MNKSIIALAIAAALPVAAQADATLSGSVEATVIGGGATSIASSVTLASSEVLANGMTATASISMLAAGAKDAGSAGLSGDFGTLSVGSDLLSEAGSEHGDVAGVMADAELGEAGISYSGTVAGLSVVASHGATVTSAGFTYDFNSLTFGAAQEGSDSAIGASYAFGDLTVKAGKATGSDAVISASYSTTVDALTVTATANNANETTATVAYTLDGITVTAEYDATGTDVSASYAAGDLTLTANSDNEVTAALDLGNADLTVERTAGATTVTYKVSF